jgi:hypothetical protein
MDDELRKPYRQNLSFPGLAIREKYKPQRTYVIQKIAAG